MQPMNLMLRTRAHDSDHRVGASVLLLLIVLALTGCGDDDGGSVQPDADVIDGGGADADAASEETDDGGLECTTDDGCSDENVCNGTERCVGGMCVRGEPLRCSDLHACIPSVGCDCDDPDFDNDTFLARECAGGAADYDCDDGDREIRPRGTETCHLGGDKIDEDCDPHTFSDPRTSDGDRDGDGKISDLCFNLDENGQRYGGDDCNDSDKTAWPGAPEVCDTADNDCDHVIDEGASEDGGVVEPFGLQVPFYPDVDHDGTGDHEAPVRLGCDRYPFPGFIPAYLPEDCDDRDLDINIDAIELCDGYDNDCDGLTDEEDQNSQPLLKPTFPGTDVRCRVPEGGGQPRLTILDCPGDLGDPDQLLWCGGPVIYGCEVDATSLEHCRRCDNACTFACGFADCDDVEALALGYHHTCALTTEGHIACWGRGAEGRLGNDSTVPSSVPVAVVSAVGARELAVGPNSACAVMGEAAELYCWGTNTDGLLGAQEPEVAWSAVPKAVISVGLEPVLADVDAVDVSNRHACAVLANGELYCWGAQANGRLGNGRIAEDFIDYPESAVRGIGYTVEDAAKLALGDKHGCIVTQAGSVECWGDNRDGQLGDPNYTEPSSATLREVPGLSGIEQITAGLAHTCVLKSGKVSCWGLNARGQLGRPESEQDGVPAEIEGLDGVTQIHAGISFTCALDNSGAVHCWGSNAWGELGDESFEDTFEPHQVLLDGEADRLATGGMHACARTTSGKTYCWGSNFYGQLGNGETSYEGRPVPQSTLPLKRRRI
jgi:alpha-tubulin suppressor-like RCC1 family protein